MKITKVKSAKAMNMEEIINHILDRVRNLEAIHKDVIAQLSDMDSELDVITEAVFASSATDGYDT